MMKYWLLYDISCSRRRLKIVQLCLDYGLKRVQKSCFLGEMSKAKCQEFEKSLTDMVSDEDSVYLIPITDTVMEGIKAWGMSELNMALADPAVCFV